MLKIPLNTKQVIFGMLFPANLLLPLNLMVGSKCIFYYRHYDYYERLTITWVISKK